MCEDFARLFLTLGSPEEAAKKAGFPPGSALAEGLKLLESKKVRRILKTASAGGLGSVQALAGLRRLAFGRINDALKLLSDDEPQDVASLDLFNVSEIKRVKGGGMEIKFFDRLEALKRLLEITRSDSENESADRLFSALRDSASSGDD